MNKPTLTPDQAIEQVCQLTGMTHEDYHNHVLTLGTAHCRQIVVRMLEVQPYGSFKDEIKLIVSEITTNHLYGYWAYFQNVCYIRNQRLVNICGHLDTATQRSFIHRIWINQLQHDRIISVPSHTCFTRKVAGIVRELFINNLSKEIIS